MHGTGTPLGDPIEVTALGRALGTSQPRAVVLCEYAWCWAAQCMISRQATHSMFAMGSWVPVLNLMLGHTSVVVCRLGQGLFWPH